jgi:hypothetical protein
MAKISPWQRTKTRDVLDCRLCDRYREKPLSAETIKKLRFSGPRLKRESRTLDVMIGLYCHKQHGSNNHMCSECRELSEYAMQRLGKCPFGEDKTTCTRCLVHCYKPVMREKIRNVMRYSCPRMIYTHPFLAVSHLVDSGKGQPRA